MKRLTVLFNSAIASSLVIGLLGCAAVRESTHVVDVGDQRHYDENYDHTDLKTLSTDVSNDLLNSPFLSQQPTPPVTMIAGIKNDTDEYIDTKSLTDQMKVKIFKSGKMRFINETRRDEILKEQGYQAKNVTPGQQAQIGKQLGAKYMMSGSFSKITKGSGRQVRVSKKKFSYYKLTMEITDITTGEITWMAEREFAREASKPLFGW